MTKRQQAREHRLFERLRGIRSKQRKLRLTWLGLHREESAALRGIRVKKGHLDRTWNALERAAGRVEDAIRSGG